MDGVQFAKMLSDKHLFELKMSCIRLPFCTLPLRTTILTLMEMAAQLGCSIFGTLSSRAILRHSSHRFPGILLRARQPTTKPTTVLKRMLLSPDTRM